MPAAARCEDEEREIWLRAHADARKRQRMMSQEERGVQQTVDHGRRLSSIRFQSRMTYTVS